MKTNKTKKKHKLSDGLKDMAWRNPELENNPAFLCLLNQTEFDEELEDYE